MSSNDVIVGVDGAAQSRTALRWASREAARRGAELLVLLAYHWRIPGAPAILGPELVEAASLRGGRLTVVQAVTATLPSWSVSLPPLAYDRDAVRLATQAELEHALTPWTEKLPDVTVAARPVIGNPSRVLVGASQGAQLMVVGTRGPRRVRRPAARLGRPAPPAPRRMPVARGPAPAVHVEALKGAQP
jgi:nucleotide-binding universal stress UspA family protein